MENKNEKIFPNFDPTKDLSLAGKNRRMKRGLGSKPLMESEIKEVQTKARSAMEAARLLGVSEQCTTSNLIFKELNILF